MKNKFFVAENQLDSEHNQELFSGIRLRFSTLNQTEKVVCALIALIPLWWLWGWSYLPMLLTVIVFAYEISQSGSFALKTPSWLVFWGMCYGFYLIIVAFFYLKSNNISFGPRQIFGTVESWLCPALLLWYIQSKQLKIRLQVVAWAFSLIILLMLVVFLASLVIFQQADYVPLRSIFGFITGKESIFEHGLGNSNYLIPYFAKDESFIPGLVRYVFFFHGPESLALIAGFIALVALDLKNRTWSLSLFAGAYFVSLLSGTRSVLVSLLFVLVIRYVINAGKTFGIALILAILAMTSFATFSIPVTSNVVFNSIEQAAQGVNETRADSSLGRSEIYLQTWKKVNNAPGLEFLFGHVIPGESVTPLYKPAKIGTHSFYLSSLLYRSGLVGTMIFCAYWITLLFWLYRTKADRPLCCFMALILFSLTFCVMELERPVMPIILLCSMLYKSVPKVRPFQSEYYG